MATRSRPLRETAAPLVPAGPLSAVRRAALGCRACPLWTLGTQTVFGVGQAHGKVMIVGEVPGDQEDREGEPFVGPAGKMLDAALAAAGIGRASVYLTNVVKHFKWKRVGKSERRIHQKPNASGVAACRPWIDAEIDRGEAARARVSRVDGGAGAAWAWLSSDRSSGACRWSRRSRRSSLRRCIPRRCCGRPISPRGGVRSGSSSTTSG